MVDSMRLIVSFVLGEKRDALAKYYEKIISSSTNWLLVFKGSHLFSLKKPL